jgi:hypothetical protein
MAYLKRIAEASKAIINTSRIVTIAPEHLPRLYSNAVAEQKQITGQEQYGDYENSKIKFNYQDDYEF